MMNREAIYNALMARGAAATFAALPISGLTAFVGSSRKWVQVALDQMPFLVQRQLGAAIVRSPGMPPMWTLKVEWLAYVAHYASQDQSVIPSTSLNNVMDGLQASLEPKPIDRDLQRCTLGGLVYDCKIKGEQQDFEGDLGDIGVLTIPVEIIVPF